jgi:CRP-like cAMP-binding protein
MAAKFIALKTVIEKLVSPPADEWSVFEAQFTARSIDSGHFFVRAGDKPDSLCFVNAGLLRFYYQTESGKEFNKSFSAENEFAGNYSAYLTATGSRFSIQALEDSHLLVAGFAEITSLYARHPCWERFGRLMAEQLYIKKEQREAEFLLDDAETRYRNFLARHPGLEQRLTQYQIASYLGITPVALSRLRKKMNMPRR